METASKANCLPVKELRRPWVFVAVVGERPGAIAAALKTWTTIARPPDRTVLLATPHIKRGPALERLRLYVESLEVDADIVEVSTELGATVHPPSVRVVAAQLKSSCGDGRLAFYADPGLKYLVAALAREFGRDALYLHADSRHLVAIDRSGRPETSYRWPLKNIGLDELLSLHGLTVGPNRALPAGMAFVGGIPPSVRQNATIEGGAGTVAFHLLQERRGWLLGLNWVSSKEDVRALERLPNALNGLYPLVSVCTGNRHARERAATVGLAVIDVDAREIARWTRGAVAPPGRVPLGKPPKGGLAHRDGGGGQGRPLIVWVGPDPSSTLRSLYTFEPSEALLLYDGGTTASKRSARRLMGVSSELPCGRIYFQPSDLVGRGLADASTGGVFSSPSRGLVADISPGTNGQACATVLLSGVELWSQRTKGGKAVALDGGASLPLETPPALVQARMRGGRLCRKPKNACAWSPHQIDMLCGLATSIVGGRWDWGRISGLVRAARSSGLSLPKKPAGAWFEELVAGLAVASGAEEVWLNVKWAWSGARSGPRVFRDEIDVLVRRGGNMFVISCKLLPPSGFSLARDASETEAVTRDGVGRLAIPVLVRPQLDGGVIRAQLGKRRGAVYLDLRGIAGPGAFGSVLDRIARSRRTT